MLLTRSIHGLEGLGATSWLPRPTPVTPTKKYTYAELDALSRSNAIAWQAEDLAYARGYSSTLPSCPASSITSTNKDGTPRCYNSTTSTLVPLPPGVFRAPYTTVPLHIAEAKNGRFDKTFKPDARTRAGVEWQIVKRSADILNTAMKRARPLGITGPSGFNYWSVGSAVKAFPEMRVLLKNFHSNPVQPTSDEMQQQGGYARWIARGGFPLHVGVVNGSVALSDKICPVTCVSPMCRCDGAPVHTPGISCVESSVATGMSTCFHIYFAVDQVEGGNFHVALIYDTPSKLEVFGNAVASLIQKIGSVVCTAIPAVKAQQEALLPTRCVFPDGTGCTQGQTKVIAGKPASCECVSPPASSQAAVALSTWAGEKWCAGWNSQNATTPVPTWEPPPMPSAESSIPKWLLLAGGVTAAYLLLRK